jgi:hypothetical protein
MDDGGWQWIMITAAFTLESPVSTAATDGNDE